MAFCRECGEQVGDDRRFCGNCGAPRNVQPVVVPPEAVPPIGPVPLDGPVAVPPPAPVSTAPRTPRRGLLLATGAAGTVLLVVAGGLVVTRFLGGGTGDTVSTFYGYTYPAPEAVTGDPEEKWSFRAPDGDVGFAIDADDGSATYVSWSDDDADSSTTHVGRLDSKGELSWSGTTSDGCYPSTTSSDDVVLCLGSGEEDETMIHAFDAGSGSELWSKEVGSIVSSQLFDGILVSKGESVEMLDLRSGDVGWRHGGGAIALNAAGDIAVADGSRLVRLDPDDGTQQWSVSGAAQDDDDNGVALSVNTQQVAVSDANGVAVYDLDSGDRLGRLGDLTGASVAPLGDQFVSELTSYDDDGNIESDTLTAVVDGKAGDQVDLGEDDSVVDVLTTGGSSYLWQDGGGDLYGADLEVVGDLPRVSSSNGGSVTGVSGGFYVQTKDRLRYVTVDGDTQWSLDLSEDDTVQGGEKGVYLLDGKRLTRFE